jgi:hypothetical protein
MGEGYQVDEENLYTYMDDVSAGAMNLHLGGTTALMMITWLGMGPGFAPVSDELTSLHTNHLAALEAARTALIASVSGLGFIGLGAGIVGANYAVTDSSAADKINGTTIDELFTPPPPGEETPEGLEEVPLTAADQRRLDAVAAALAGGDGNGASRTMNPQDGSITVTVPEVPVIPPPPVPGREQAPASATARPPSTTYTTGRENDLPADTRRVNPDAPPTVSYTGPSYRNGVFSGGDLTSRPAMEDVYDEEVRSAGPELPQLDLDAAGEVELAPGPDLLQPSPEDSGLPVTEV